MLFDGFPAKVERGFPAKRLFDGFPATSLEGFPAQMLFDGFPANNVKGFPAQMLCAKVWRASQPKFCLIASQPVIYRASQPAIGKGFPAFSQLKRWEFKAASQPTIWEEFPTQQVVEFPPASLQRLPSTKVVDGFPANCLI